MKQRLATFKLRIPLFRRPRLANVDPAKIIRTGGIVAIVYGQAILGVPNVLLRQQRIAVGKAAAKWHGVGASLI